MSGNHFCMDENGNYHIPMSNGLDRLSEQWEERLEQAVIAEREACILDIYNYLHENNGSCVFEDLKSCIRARGEKE